MTVEEKMLEIEKEISCLGLPITSNQIRQFYDYYELLIKWNEVMNLTAITNFEDVVKKHFVDSLSIVQIKKMTDVDNLIDIGTGAGFPGIPLKIMFPHLKVTLLDSLRKRIDFLDQVVKQLNLKEVETIHGRAEDYAKPGKKREQYNLCVSRAVANLSTLCEYCLPYVKIGGSFIAYKSKEAKQETENAKSAIFLLGGRIREWKEFELPGTDVWRSLVNIQKVSGCPKKYPRKPGTVTKHPL